MNQPCQRGVQILARGISKLPGAIKLAFFTNTSSTVLLLPEPTQYFFSRTHILEYYSMFDKKCAQKLDEMERNIAVRRVCFYAVLAINIKRFAVVVYLG